MAMTFTERLERVLRPLRNRIASMLVKAIIKSVDDSGNLQMIKVTMHEGDTKDEIERIQQFGFTSHPPVDSEAILFCIGGNRTHAVVLNTDSSKYRLKNLPKGAVALYNENGDYVKLTKDKIEVYAKEVNLGTADFKKLINEEFKSIFDNHVHNFTAAPSGVFSTSKPATLISPVPPPIPTPIPPVGGAVAPMGLTLGDAQMTTKTKAE
jgi:phage baseplate assembly protein V